VSQVRRILAVLLSVAFLLPLFATPAAAQDARTFAETGKTVQGAFLDFYDAKGGSLLFGAPITDQLVEGGRTVQYFAKARFELWPENPAGFQVQLGLLAAQLGKVQPAIQADTSGDPNRRFFPETGHVLAYSFKTFWEAHGGVDVFGYPTTEQLVENGLIVQYTQRMRLEWHPEDAANPVQVGDLGREYLGLGPQTVAAPAPAATAPAAADDVLIFHQTNGGDIYTVRTDGSDLRKVAHGLDPSWSPDRQHIVYVSWDYPWGIYIADPDGGNARLVYQEQWLQSPQMSPDGRFIAYTQKYQALRLRPSLLNGRPIMLPTLVDCWRVAAVDVQTGQVHQVDSGDDESNSPSWAPDGQLVFAETQGLDVLNQIEANRQVSRLAGTDTRYLSPAWSPDGSKIAVMWKQNDHYEIGIVNADGSGFHLLTASAFGDTPANNVAPSWSPDGKSIAFFSDRTGAWQIWLMNADGSSQRQVNTGSLELVYQLSRERPVDW
jgi:hypothetical protein